MVVTNILLKSTCLVITVLNSVASQNFEELVVRGKRAKIENFPHSAYLYIECWIGYSNTYSCGSSIVNQMILLTAAHCFHSCRDGTYITAFVGSSEAGEGTGYLAATFKKHEAYKSFNNDIALVRLRKNIVFGKKVSRVSVMRDPPRRKYARVAGWGTTTDDIRGDPSYYLMQIKQKVRSRLQCMAILDLYRDLEKGYICGGKRNAKSYISVGDSGSALMVRKYIQIGIVSYTSSSKSISVAMYTDVAYYHDWIQKTSNDLGCRVFNFPTTEPYDYDSY